MPETVGGGESRIEPIRPEEAAEAFHVPDEVIGVFNDLITEGCVNGHVTVMQKDVVKRLVDMGVSRKDIFDKGWLNVEQLFEGAGWEVGYDRPGYNESYEPSFTFRARTTASGRRRSY
ncbi:MAG TPA: hypothetical protein VK694_00170 [Verrucomicrobiae bacterium]|nr:hypothetical protein [Verrucomicrobiae bacterium]